MTRRGHVMVLLAAVLALSADVNGQPVGSAASSGLSIFGSAGWASLWDDETFLGRGILISGGLSQPIGTHIVAEGEVAWADHHRNSGYLEADGNPVVVTARLLYAFRSRVARVRPFAGIGIAAMHQTGHFTWRSLVRGPGLVPVEGPSTRTDWSVTDAGLEFSGGATIRSGDRVFVRPAFRWTSVGAASKPRAVLEPPIFMPRVEVAVGWTVR